MPNAIFLSYAESDFEIAQHFRKWLATSLTTTCFMAKEGVRSGKVWLEEINHEIATCKVGVVLVTTRSFQRPWISFELGALTARGIPIHAVIVREPGVDPKSVSTLPTISERQYTVWSDENASKLASDIYNDIYDASSEDEDKPRLSLQKVNFCTEPIQLGPTTADEFIKELFESRPLATAPYLAKTFSDSAHKFAPVLIDPFIKEYCEALDDALRGRGIIKLTSRYRMAVAERLIRHASSSVSAISVISNDPWLFDSPDDLDYLDANCVTGRKLLDKGRVKRIVIPPNGKSPDSFDSITIDVLRRMHDHDVDLLWIDREDAERAIGSRHEARVENLLIVDEKWMTESTGWGHNGRYVIEEPEIINPARKRFNLLWKKSKSFPEHILPKRRAMNEC